MKFLIDAQLPIPLVRFLRAQGFEAVHVADVGMKAADDDEIWMRAISFDEIIVTKDEDFAVRRMLATTGPCVIWLRIGNSSNRSLVIWLTAVWDGLIARLQAGDTLVEVVCSGKIQVEPANFIAGDMIVAVKTGGQRGCQISVRKNVNHR